ncbi:hypothetical protein KW786_03235, partial [Candidatus Parcubacteria bacterium]|nr:hypothetical protein [Candidatus Parcubacteria bacterium]
RGKKTWQLENEPLVEFGECPSWYYENKDFLKQEVALVKSMDPSRPVIISDSGETSWWIDAARIGDMVGITLYRKAFIGESKETGFYKTYELKPSSYWRRAQLVAFLFGKKVFSSELQAEPWSYKNPQESELAEQEKTMDVQQLKNNIRYAKSTGLEGFYLWGTEWWYWMKETKNKPGMWDAARELFKYGKIEDQ